MQRFSLLAISVVCLAGASAATSARAQQPSAQQPAAQAMGTVATQDALVSGGLQVQGDRAELMSNASVTAHDHTATVALARGGEVLVCATSQFHLLRSGTGKSLLFGLDRGALEIHGASDPQDMILTPDMMFKIEYPGTFDLRLRVTRDGDTCVDNAGSTAPVLTLSDAFSTASYRLIPGQHVLFEHGDLHEVVDNEQSPCGCPAPTPPVESAAGASAAGLSAPAAAAAEHPFPAAVSEGLAPVQPPANSAPPGQKHTQIAATLAFGPGEGPPPATVPAPAASSSSASVAAGGSVDGVSNGPSAPPPTPPGAHTIFHKIGHFFHRIFHPRRSQAPSR